MMLILTAFQNCQEISVGRYPSELEESPVPVDPVDPPRPPGPALGGKPDLPDNPMGTPGLLPNRNREGFDLSRDSYEFRKNKTYYFAVKLPLRGPPNPKGVDRVLFTVCFDVSCLGGLYSKNKVVIKSPSGAIHEHITTGSALIPMPYDAVGWWVIEFTHLDGPNRLSLHLREDLFQML